MSSSKVFTLCLVTILMSCVLAGATTAYQPGTITIASGSSKQKSYNLKGAGKIFTISNCGEFKDGQDVQFFVKDNKVYIAHEGAKDYKCSLDSTTESLDPNSQPTANDMSVVYIKGKILGFSIRRDIHVSGGGSNGGSVLPIGSSTRKAKVYELQGPSLIYQVDYCGAFQAGQFAPGQEVEFRVDTGGGRLYIRHDGTKEYSCQLEGTRQPDASAGEGIQSAAATPASAAAAAPQPPAKLSVTSIPNEADIEVDGNFAGNTPSDLQVDAGDHSIVVKKSGYKTWERKMKLAAGSNIHLSAELEKSANP